MLSSSNKKNECFSLRLFFKVCDTAMLIVLECRNSSVLGLGVRCCFLFLNIMKVDCQGCTEGLFSQKGCSPTLYTPIHIHRFGDLERPA